MLLVILRISASKVKGNVLAKRSPYGVGFIKVFDNIYSDLILFFMLTSRHESRPRGGAFSLF